ncbi:MAG: FtsX-like permease family protein [Flavobacteriales bacterium]|nr:FtsX-like permease family protein [Flavobacteriales bacterium]
MSRKKPSSLPITVSVSMVLFLLGLLGALLINSSRLTEHFKENVVVMVYFSKQAPDAEIQAARMDIAARKFVRNSKFISPEEAAYEFKEELGENFTEILGDNPLPASMEVYLALDRVGDDVDAVLEELRQVSGVYEVEYEQYLVDQINRNKNLAAMGLGGLALLLVVISLLLINNTVRLSVYSRRFLVKSMQLVGAREWFIIRPFLLRSLFVALIGAVIALGLTILSSYAVYRAILLSYGGSIPNLPQSSGISDYSILFVALLILGVLIVIPTTYLSTRRYLRMKIDDLY